MELVPKETTTPIEPTLAEQVDKATETTVFHREDI
jgi:hypothetical protein